MLDGDGQVDELIDEPGHVEDSFLLAHDHDVILLRGGISKPCQQPVVRGYRLLHVVQAKVAWDAHMALYVEVKLEKRRCLAYGQRHGQVSPANLRCLDGGEVFVREVEVQGRRALLQAFQVYPKGIQGTHYGLQSYE